jgi:hypothetical protein
MDPILATLDTLEIGGSRSIGLAEEPRRRITIPCEEKRQ